jgi:hypothetical protein
VIEQAGVFGVQAAPVPGQVESQGLDRV